MSQKKICCFTGHRPQKLGFSEQSEKCGRLKEKLRETIISLIEQQGVSHFISGMALGVDTICAIIVSELKCLYPHITLECALPCTTQADRWTASQKETYSKIISQSDKVTILSEDYTPYCMQKRNKYMVDNSDFVLCVWNGSSGGTGSTVKYARKCQKAIYLIDPLTLFVTEC